MTVHARTRWPATLTCIAFAALMLLHPTPVRLFTIVPLAVAVVVVNRMRLGAGPTGVTVVNLRKRRIPWSEISEFALGRVGPSICLEISLRDGSRAHAWVVTTTGPAALSEARVTEVIGELRQRLILATGESSAELDARAVDDALRSAGEGRHQRASALVAEGRIDARDMAERLVRQSRRRQESDAQPGR
jgi:hypothetical protein